ncbi:MAG: 3'(2'),5'-bisphosphate nucleotidase CysQ [Crocinitomix sp.]|nr:3'(2'),5'-bisphosphate nucleotidase CysQ [Crocinitomix sp.]
MKNLVDEIKIWVDLAIEASIEASKKIITIYEKNFEVEYKKDHSPVTLADKASSDIINKYLSKTGIPIISEEEQIPSFEIRKTYPMVWLVDPLDGTKEFIKKNDEFCICIALIHENKPVFGLIASPTDKKILFGGSGMEVFYASFDEALLRLDKNKIQPLQHQGKLTIAHSRSHFNKKTMSIIDNMTSLYGEPSYIKKGSALKFIDLVVGSAQFYPRMAPTMEWDIAAGHAIYEAVGGEVLDFITFEPLTYNKMDLFNPFFIAKKKEIQLLKQDE